MTAALHAVTSDTITDEMGADHLRRAEVMLLALGAARTAGMPLPIRSQVDDLKVILFVSSTSDLDQWARFVEEPVTKTRLITGRSVLGVDVVLLGVPFRIVCGKPVA